MQIFLNKKGKTRTLGKPLDKNNKHIVILLHGIARTHFSMRRIEKVLIKAGFETLNISYPSRHFDIDSLAKLIHNNLLNKILEKETKLYFVTHSMGGLVLQALVKAYPEVNNLIRRAVMLAPPNKGSYIAEYLKNNILYKKFYGPAGQQLGTSQIQDHIFNKKFDFNLGIIAGLYDTKVKVEHTKHQYMDAHRVHRTGHSLILINKKVKRDIVHFLKTGNFD